MVIAIRDALARWVRGLVPAARTDQDVVRWASDDERAILDVVCRRGGGLRRCVRRQFGAPSCGPWGAAAHRAPRAHQEPAIPRPLGLSPFVLDTHGSWGREASDKEKEERAEAVWARRVAMAKALQLSVADQLLVGAICRARREGADSWDSTGPSGTLASHRSRGESRGASSKHADLHKEPA